MDPSLVVVTPENRLLTILRIQLRLPLCPILFAERAALLSSFFYFLYYYSHDPSLLLFFSFLFLGASSSGSLELDVEAILSSINDDIQASGPLESAAGEVRFPKVELGLSNLSGDVLFRSLVAHQVKSIILTQACARELQNSSGDSLLASSLEASLSAKDDSLKVSSAAASDLLAEVEVLRGHKSSLVSDLSILEEKIREKKASLEKEKLFNEHRSSRLSKASQLKIVSADNSFAKSLALCDLVKVLFQALGAKYDEVPADVSLEVMNEWLRLNLAGLMMLWCL
ncbi:hypothetical protein EJB05_08378, partial [Eragrostis curvula]